MTPEFESLLRRRWRLLALFCLINFTTGALYVWSVFAGPLAAHLSLASGEAVTPASLGPVFGLATGITPFLMLGGGFFNDRIGPKGGILSGGVSIAAGYLLASTAESSGLLYLAYGVLVGAGTGLVNGCTISSAVKFFPDRRGLAGGTVTAFLGIGAASLPFAAAGLIGALGVTTSLAVFGVASGVVIVGAALLTERCPEGFSEAFERAGAARRTAARSFTPIEMARTPLFWPLFALFTCSATMGLMLLSNISSIAQTQIGAGPALAALSVSVISAANTCGRFLSGALSDRFGRIQTLIATLVLAMGGFGLLMISGRGDAALFLTGVVGIGVCFGAFIGIYPSLVADEYGPRHNSVNFSLMMFGYSVGGLVGPLLIGWASRGAAGDFSRAYLVSIFAALAGVACAAAALWIKRRGQMSQA